MSYLNKKRVAITANTSWYLYNFRKNTIISLVASGYDVIAVAPKDEYSVKLSELGCKYVDIRIDQGGINPFKDLMTLVSMCWIIYTLRFDAILNFTPKNNIYFSLAARLFNIPVINNIAGLGGLLLRKECSALFVVCFINSVNAAQQRYFSRMKKTVACFFLILSLTILIQNVCQVPVWIYSALL